MSLVTFVLKRPYTVVALLILICLLGIGAALRMPIDIFPEINIPVVSVVWTYNGMSARDIQNRILTLHERQMASLVDDIARIEATSYEGVGVEQGLSARGRRCEPRGLAAREQRAGRAEVHAAATSRRRWSSATAPPTCRSSSSACRATRCPTPRSTISGRTSSGRTWPWCTAPQVPYPYGGKPRVIMADLDQQALAGARA